MLASLSLISELLKKQYYLDKEIRIQSKSMSHQEYALIYLTNINPEI